MAECAINRWSKGKFRGFSAGSHPKGVVHPITLELLTELNYETSGLRSKSWDGSPGRTVRRWISYLPCATRLRARRVRFGRGSRNGALGRGRPGGVCRQ